MTDSERIEQLVRSADLPSLLAALAHARGDRKLLDESLWLDPARALEPGHGWDRTQRRRARHLAREGVAALISSGGGSIAPTGNPPAGASRSHQPAEAPHGGAAGADDSLVAGLIDWLTGTDLADDYRTMLAEELAVFGDMRIPEPIAAGGWPAEARAGGTDGAVVAVIGAGMSGILAAHRLKQAGISCVVLDKNRDVGGTWLENSYPGCRVDVFNHVYSYSGEQRGDWPEYHSSQEVLLDYFRECARRWGIGDRIRFGTTVESMAWDDATKRWHLRLRTNTGDAAGARDSSKTTGGDICDTAGTGAGGSDTCDTAGTGAGGSDACDTAGTGAGGGDTCSETITVAAVVSAVGQLNRPLVPDIAGIDDFSGEQFHSSSWRHDIDCHGRTVAVIGTGASALQFIPHLAERAAHVTVFQRTPPWLIPRPNYHEPLPEELLELFEIVPGYAHWFRLRQFWCTHEGTVSALRRDPAWEGPLEQAVSARNDEARRMLTLYLESQFADRPDLLAQVVPGYPVGAKRVVLDNGVWARTLKRPNVELASSGIERIEPAGVRGADGRLHRCDVIVYGTGFRASEFLMPMRVTGRGGADLHESWSGAARAYNGVCVPGFPNLFCIYGPNTNIVVNGSIIYFAECAVNYTVECLRLLANRGAAAMDCRPDAYDRYRALMDEQNSQMAWGISTVNSWYKSPGGGVAQNWPLPLIDYWRQTRSPDPTDFELL